MKTKQARQFDRRSLIAGGGVALAGFALLRVGVEVAAQEATPATGGEMTAADLREKMQSFDYLWSATSPATRQGDVFSLSVRNDSNRPLQLWVRSVIMDHAAHHKDLVINEEFELAAGELQSFQAPNNYGVANHFSTRVFATTGEFSELGLEALLTDASGVETASFNQRAFMVQSREELQAKAEDRRSMRRGHKQSHEHEHSETGEAAG